MIQSCSMLDGCSDNAISGRAKLSTVLSTETSSTGSMSTASANQPRQPARVTAISEVGNDEVSMLPIRFLTVQPV